MRWRYERGFESSFTIWGDLLLVSPAIVRVSLSFQLISPQYCYLAVFIGYHLRPQPCVMVLPIFQVLLHTVEPRDTERPALELHSLAQNTRITG